MAGAAVAVAGFAWIVLAAPFFPRLAALVLAAIALRQLRFYPRKTIEIGWCNLLAALRFTLLPSGPGRASLEASISRRWSARGDAFACLSVRTGFDLLLAKLALPEGSEVLFAPGITIPAMVEIVKAHKLRAIGIEPHSSTELLVSELKRYITAETRVLVITHLFGAVLDCAPLVREAQAQGLFVVEDCAQAFIGAASKPCSSVKDGFRGHEETDAVFFSFGLMKTLTALGGAICCVRDAQLRKAMLELQSTYPIRSNSQFLTVALKACALKLFGNPYLWGLAASLVSAAGGDFDGLVVGSVRGFPNRASFRLRPCTPLLQLLDSRLCNQAPSRYEHNAEGPVPSMVARRRQCGGLAVKQLAEGGATIISAGKGPHSWWLLPLFDEQPQSMVQDLWARGFDATCSSTQLTAVGKCTPGSSSLTAHDLMKSIVYLPLSAEMPQHKAKAMAEAVLEVRQRRAVGAPEMEEAAMPKVAKGGRPVQSGTRVGLSLLLLAVALAVWPSVVLPWLPSARSFQVPLLAGLLATVVLVLMARRLAAEPQLRMDRDVLLALGKKPRVEGVDFCRSQLHLEGKIDGAVLLTGATGFVGGGILFALLAGAKELGISRVVLLIRRKAGANVASRLSELRASPAFEQVREAFDQLVVALEGDAAQIDFGWQDPERKWPYSEPLRGVLHCAGDVRFNQSLQQAAANLISGTLQVVQLAARWKAGRFVAISTAFVHAVPSATDHLAERLVELRDFDPMELYRDAINHGSWAEKAMHSLGFPNTYTFAKAIAEHLVLPACAAHGLDARIVRPSVVGPAWAAPFAGWCGDRPSTITLMATLLARRRLRLFRCSTHPGPIVPVDLVAAASVRALTGMGGRIVHAAVDSSEAGKVPSFHAIMRWLFQVLVLHGDLLLPEAGLLFKLLHWAEEPNVFWLLHTLVNLLPNVLLLVTSTLASMAGFAGLKGKGGCTPPVGRALRSMTALQSQYLPFADPPSAWLFSSSLRLPENWDPMEYCLLIIQAVLGFTRSASSSGDVTSASRRSRSKLLHDLRVVSPRSVWHDAFVAFSMPGSSLGLSLVAFLVRRVLHWMDVTVTVDAASLVSVTDLSAPLVLCPTHRSILDFLIIGVACFQLRPLLPALQVPHVAADAEFERLPVLGRVLAALGAFFVRRGGGAVQPDPALRAKVGHVFRQGRPLEVFLEGARSRGRRQLQLRTGLLRALRDVSQRTMALVPLALSYELLPEDRSFYNELRGLPRSPLSILVLLDWVRRGLRGELPCHGDAHVRLGTPQTLDGTSNLKELLAVMQEQLVGLTSLTDLHARALAEVLELPPAAVCDALCAAGVPLRRSRLGLGLPLTEAQLWPLALQATTLLHRRLPRPWARWVVEPVVERRPPACAIPMATPGDAGHTAAAGTGAVGEEINCKAAIQAHSPKRDSQGDSVPSKGAEAEEAPLLDLDAVVAALCEQLEAAVSTARAAADRLQESGVANISEEHLLQQLLQDDQRALPAPLARGAACIVAKAAAVATRQAGGSGPPAATPEPTHVVPLWPAAFTPPRQQSNEESLDRWGFRDTKFVAQWVDGQPAVQITSKRYGAIAERPSHRLWAFFRQELNAPLAVRGTLLERPLPEAPEPAAWLLECLAAVVPEARVRHDAEARLRACTGHGLEDIWKLRTREAFRMPDAVVRPESEDEVLAVLKAAVSGDGEACGFAVLPVGGRTNVTSATACPEQHVDPRPFVALDMRGLNRLLWANSEDAAAHVEAGITGSALKEALASKGLTMGMEPDSMELSTLGGWIATRASGMKRARYGNIEDMLLEVRVATPVGMLWQRHGSTSCSSKTAQSAFGRTSTSVDLAGLILGSEGCLGIVTSAVVRVRPLPEAVTYQSVAFPDWASGAAWMRQVAQLPAALRPASCRLMDNKQFRLSRALQEDSSSSPSLRHYLRTALKSAWLHAAGISLDTASAATLLFEGSQMEVAMQRKALGPLVRRAGGVWGGSSSGEAGYAMTFAVAYLRDFGMDHHILSESLETFAPWSVIEGVWPAVVAAVEATHRTLQVPGRPFLSCRMTQLYDEGAVLYMYLGVYTGGLEARCALEVFQRLERTARVAILDAGGCLSHHHGVGKLRASLLPAGQAPALGLALRGLKAAIDPKDVLSARNGAWAAAENAAANAEEAPEATGFQHVA